MKNTTQKEAPLLEGGQGRSGADLEAEALALSWLTLLIVAVTGGATIGFAIVGLYS
jgi:hypothetical protein